MVGTMMEIKHLVDVSFENINEEADVPVNPESIRRRLPNLISSKVSQSWRLLLI